MKLTYTKTCRNTTHNNGDKVVEIAICGGAKLKSSEANFVQRLVVNAEGFI